VVKFLGDGTFGRVLRVQLKNNFYACKVVKSVDRYIDSARMEAQILDQVLRRDEKNESHCVLQIDYFSFHKHHKKHYAIVLEELGKSLYEVIKSNGYRGNSYITF